MTRIDLAATSSHIGGQPAAEVADLATQTYAVCVVVALAAEPRPQSASTTEAECSTPYTPVSIAELCCS